jgi:hypothetical protein
MAAPLPALIAIPEYDYYLVRLWIRPTHRPRPLRTAWSRGQCRPPLPHSTMRRHRPQAQSRAANGV